MLMRERGLWMYVIFLSMLFGGALFERIVLVAVWSSDLPRSVRDWNGNPRLTIHPTAFFRQVTPFLIVLTPLEVYFAWTSTGPERSTLLLSTVLLIAVLVATLAYFAPTLARLTLHGGEGMDDGQIVRTARRWVALQYVRLGAVAVAWLASLEALRLYR